MRCYIFVFFFLFAGAITHGQKQSDLENNKLTDLEYFKKEILQPDQLDEEDLRWKKSYKDALILEYSGFAIVAGATGYLAYKFKKNQGNNNVYDDANEQLSAIGISTLLILSGLTLSRQGTKERKQTISDFRSTYYPLGIIDKPQKYIMRINLSGTGLSLSYHF